MCAQSNRWNLRKLFSCSAGCVACLSLAVSVLLNAGSAEAATTWDSFAVSEMGAPLGNGTSWWFDPINWSTTNPGDAAPFYLPPGNDTGAVTDVLINAGAAASMDVVYDPSTNDPNFAAIGANPTNFPFPTGYDAQTVWRIYLGREAVGASGGTGNVNLTIRGDLKTDNTGGDTRWQIGRSSGTAGVASNAIIVQEKGVVKNLYGDLDLGSNDSGLVGSFGNGTYDYRGGTFEHGVDNNTQTTYRLRLSAGGSTAVGGVGKFISRNPGIETGGYVRVQDFQVAPFGGQNGFEPNGVTNGLGIVEFHSLSEGTRPIQVVNNLTLNNGKDPVVSDTGVRSAQLKLVLDEAPLLTGGVPIDLGLFDVDSDNDGVGSIASAGGGLSGFGLTFSDANAANPLDISAVYDAGDIVTAMFGSSTYRWKIYYDGNIAWSDADNSILNVAVGGGDGITGPGTGRDIVLIGLDSMVISEGLDGDFNNDNKVDAADYTVWRDNFGGNSSVLNGNGSGAATVVQADYDLWKAQFGQMAGSGSLAASAVPEPASAVLMLMTVLGVAGVRRRNA